MKQITSFGWRVNGSADGFEQPHGRFTMEVFWDDANRDMPWAWLVWTNALVQGKADQTIVSKGKEPSLDWAKRAVIEKAAKLEKVALQEDKKFR